MFAAIWDFGDAIILLKSGEAVKIITGAGDDWDEAETTAVMTKDHPATDHAGWWWSCRSSLSNACHLVHPMLVPIFRRARAVAL
jgi:hypothetical protein